MVWVTFVVVPPAQVGAATAAQIELSRDGFTWSASLAEPLFDESVRWVPGDVREERFYVRNASQDRAAINVEILAGTAESAISASEVLIEARIDDGPWLGIATPASERVAAGSVEPRDSTSIDVRVTFRPWAGNQGQQQTIDLDVRVVLVAAEAGLDDAGGAGADAGDGQRSSGGPLPRTGAVVSHSTIIMATASLGCGVLLAGAGRRRGRERSDAA